MATEAEARKIETYRELKDNGYIFQPVALEVQGSLAESSEIFITRPRKQGFQYQYQYQYHNTNTLAFNTNTNTNTLKIVQYQYQYRFSQYQYQFHQYQIEGFRYFEFVIESVIQFFLFFQLLLL